MSCSSEEPRERHTSIHTRNSPGFLERLGETMGGMVVGVAIFFLSFYVLFTNEGRAIRTSSSLDEGLSQVITLHPDVYVDPQNNGHLVHLSASLRTTQRNVEMYQWVEYQESRWLFYRPLLAGLIAAIALLPVLITHSRKTEKKHQ
ncbi:Transmembrane protein 43 [Bagarius yarrelli]|uniref:Transmembrane protein 43 n=1 Tax=Bagarius yarrelli TaxID=175774 RepID=A0A556VVC3_BAGYA|nr:Transmembrane protein 43 [Bagarius yarrelli]